MMPAMVTQGLRVLSEHAAHQALSCVLARINKALEAKSKGIKPPGIKMVSRRTEESEHTSVAEGTAFRHIVTVRFRLVRDCETAKPFNITFTQTVIYHQSTRRHDLYGGQWKATSGQDSTRPQDFVIAGLPNGGNYNARPDPTTGLYSVADDDVLSITPL